MTKDELTTSKNILSGINFLVMEAERSGMYKLGRILRVCANDVCLYLENEDADVVANAVLDHSLMKAIEFLSRFASIKDASLKQDILAEIDSVRDDRSRNTELSFAQAF